MKGANHISRKIKEPDQIWVRAILCTIDIVSLYHN